VSHSTSQNVQTQLQSDDRLHFAVQLAEFLGRQSNLGAAPQAPWLHRKIVAQRRE